MKKIVLVLAIALLAFSGCKQQGGASKGKTLKVGIVLSIGGLGDKSFNDSAYRGLEMAQKDFGIEFDYVEPASPAEDEQFLTQYAEAGFDLIVATGFLMKDACEKVAQKYPDVKFIMIDSVIELPNVVSLTFKEHEGSFLVGAMAAMVSKTNTIGFVGGMDIPLIRKFQAGYEQGVKYVNPDAKILALYTTGANPFNDPVQGKNNATNLIDQGADVVYHAAGATGLGVIDACKEKEVWAIGVDSNQDGEAPGFVLTSMMKNVDVGVYNVIGDLSKGKFEGGLLSLGIKENGVGTTDFQYSKDKIPAGSLDKLEEITAKVASGEITIKESL